MPIHRESHTSSAARVARCSGVLLTKPSETRGREWADSGNGFRAKEAGAWESLQSQRPGFRPLLLLWWLQALRLFFLLQLADLVNHELGELRHHVDAPGRVLLVRNGLTHRWVAGRSEADNETTQMSRGTAGGRRERVVEEGVEGGLYVLWPVPDLEVTFIFSWVEIAHRCERRELTAAPAG